MAKLETVFWHFTVDAENNKQNYQNRQFRTRDLNQRFLRTKHERCQLNNTFKHKHKYLSLPVKFIAFSRIHSNNT
jgi:dolichyl-phosphate-mannose--protein O-mannosyl transferase